MTVHVPTIKQLQYLVALRRHGHFGKAADACFVTQSTLSAGLRDLETLLAVTLVERTRRVVRFTALGEKIADKAIRVLQEAEELAEMARAEGEPLHGELRMGVIPTIAPFLLPAMLPRLRNEWPKLKLYLREETSQAACDALHRGRLDCVLLALPYACGDVDSATLFEDPLYVAFPMGEAPDGETVDVDSIDEKRMLLLEDGHCLKDHALSACNRPELRAQAAMMGTSLHTLVQMVDNGLGITFIPSMAIDAGILDGTRVDARPLRSDHGFRRIALIWRRSSPRENEFQLLATALRRIMADLSPARAAIGPGQQRGPGPRAVRG
ncbi:MAG TPA: LysR substrate-binding domain-containing protein [Allosphingosinicella sp.]|nr:LysR substrate-binding domain-containing protein [Allosphingosinicella sp.]